MVRFLFRLLVVLAATLLVGEIVTWLIHGGPGRALRGRQGGGFSAPDLIGVAPRVLRVTADLLVGALSSPLAATFAGAALLLGTARLAARSRRRYVRLNVVPYRTDHADAHALARMFASLQARLLCRWWSRVLTGQPSVSLEVHHLPSRRGEAARAWLAVTCISGQEASVEAAMQVGYPNLRLEPAGERPGSPPAIVRLRKHRPFIERTAGAIERFEREPEPLMDRLVSAMAATAGPAIVQFALTPAPVSFEAFARWLYRRRERHLAGGPESRAGGGQRSLVADAELRGGLEVQHRPLFFADIRVVAEDRRACEAIASVLRSQRAENRLVERTTGVRNHLLGGYGRRIQRGEGNPIPGPLRGVLATTELAALWQLPSVGYTRVPFSRSALPLAPAPPEILRPTTGPGTLRDALGPVSIHVGMRRQNTAVPGTVEQGKSSYLVASVAEDLLRERCAVIVLDPKGDAADAALSAVPEGRTCTLLDFAHPTCGFNPLAVDAPPDVIADYVVGALKNLFTDAPFIFRP